MAFVPEITLGKFPDSIKSYVAPPVQTAIPNHAPPSFPCAKAVTNVEKMICADPGLSLQDTSLARDYKRIRSAVLAAESRRLTLDQRAWLKERNTCETVDCLMRTYNRRITAVCNAYPLDPDARPMGAKRAYAPDRFVFRAKPQYGEPDAFKGKAYKVEFDDENHAVKTGKVNKDGIINVKRPQNAKVAKVIIYAFGKGKKGFEWRINLDNKMENYTTLEGVQSRLRNLGFYTGKINGVLDLTTESAVRDFKHAQKLPATSDVDNCFHVLLMNQHDL
jgi:uncharacterized protein